MYPKTGSQKTQLLLDYLIFFAYFPKKRKWKKDRAVKLQEKVVHFHCLLSKQFRFFLLKMGGMGQGSSLKLGKEGKIITIH